MTYLHTPTGATAAPTPWPAASAPAEYSDDQMTPAFPGDVEPVQIGVYQRRNSLGRWVYSMWTGDHWCWNHASPSLAARDEERSLQQAMPWRGLITPPPQGYGPAIAGALPDTTAEALPC